MHVNSEYHLQGGLPAGGNMNAMSAALIGAEQIRDAELKKRINDVMQKYGIK